MSTELLILLIVVVAIIGWIPFRRKEDPNYEPSSTLGIRRERASKRKAPANNPLLFKTSVDGAGRKFYLDVKQGTTQRYLTLTEMDFAESEKLSYTIIVFESELRGLHKAIGACLKTMGYQ